jgi:hypothetical protein
MHMRLYLIFIALSVCLAPAASAEDQGHHGVPVPNTQMNSFETHAQSFESNPSDRNDGGAPVLAPSARTFSSSSVATSAAASHAEPSAPRTSSFGHYSASTTMNHSVGYSSPYQFQDYSLGGRQR